MREDNERIATKPHGIDRFVAHFGIDLDVKTDPDLLNDILHNDFQIADFSPFMEAMHEQLAEPQDLSGLLEQIRRGIIEKHPSIDELLNRVVEADLISRAELSQPVIERAVHLIYLQNCLSEFGDSDFTNEFRLINYLKNRRHASGVPRNPVTSWAGLYRAFRALRPRYMRAFFVVKVKSVDFVLQHVFMQRIRTGTAEPMTAVHKGLAVTALIVNIAEAIAADLISKNYKNAAAGMALNLVLPRHVHSRAEDPAKVELGYSDTWTSLYHSWNCAYVTGTGVLFILPKLIIPLVANSESTEYIHKRTMALNNSLGFLISGGTDSKVYTPLENADQIMRIWGEINVRHAKDLLKETYLPRRSQSPADSSTRC